MIANTEMYDHWNGDEGRFWAGNQQYLDRVIAPHHRRFMAAVAVSAGERVLDVGCGNGASTRDAARAAAPGGSVLGLDLSAPMLEVARQSAQEEGLDNVAHEHGDVQVHPLAEGAFDVAMSRFGVMFFADPVAAFANIATAVRPGGRLAVLVWQAPARNSWAAAMAAALAAGRDLPPPAPGAPGPFGLADPERTEGILTAAGWSGVGFDSVEEPFRIADDTASAYTFAQGLGMVRALLEGLDEDARSGALENLRELFAAHETADGVLFGSASWVVTATRP